MGKLDAQATNGPRGCVQRAAGEGGVPVTATAWGSLQWMVGRHNGASKNMTLGRVTFKPGMGNPMHLHPNCEEVLYVLAGEVEHTLAGGGTVRLGVGDCIVIEPGVPHRAVNVGKETAVVLVSFNDADRQTVVKGEGTE